MIGKGLTLLAVCFFSVIVAGEADARLVITNPTPGGPSTSGPIEVRGFFTLPVRGNFDRIEISYDDRVRKAKVRKDGRITIRWSLTVRPPSRVSRLPVVIKAKDDRGRTLSRERINLSWRQPFSF